MGDQLGQRGELEIPFPSRRQVHHQEAADGALKQVQPKQGEVKQAPVRRSIRDRMASGPREPNPLVDSSIDLLDDSVTYRIDVTGVLVEDEQAPLPITVEHVEEMGVLDPRTASAHHVLCLPSGTNPDELEALAVSVWNQAGWLSPGVLQLLESATLDGPWRLEGKDCAAWVLRCPPRRAAAPAPEIVAIDELAAAFPEGMPVGAELHAIQFLRKVARRLDGELTIAGSGHVFAPSPESAVNLKLFSDEWLSPQQLRELLEERGLEMAPASPLPQEEGVPYAYMLATEGESQVLLGVRPETFTPRALRWELWARTHVFIYELVWVVPEGLMELEKKPTRSGRLERSFATRTIEVAAATIASQLLQAAIIDEDGFLLALDEPLPEEEQKPL